MSAGKTKTGSQSFLASYCAGQSAARQLFASAVFADGGNQFTDDAIKMVTSHRPKSGDFVRRYGFPLRKKIEESGLLFKADAKKKTIPPAPEKPHVDDNVASILFPVLAAMGANMLNLPALLPVQASFMRSSKEGISAADAFQQLQKEGALYRGLNPYIWRQLIAPIVGSSGSLFLSSEHAPLFQELGKESPTAQHAAAAFFVGIMQALATIDPQTREAEAMLGKKINVKPVLYGQSLISSLRLMWMNAVNHEIAKHNDLTGGEKIIENTALSGLLGVFLTPVQHVTWRASQNMEVKTTSEAFAKALQTELAGGRNIFRAASCRALINAAFIFTFQVLNQFKYGNPFPELVKEENLLKDISFREENGFLHQHHAIKDDELKKQIQLIIGTIESELFKLSDAQIKDLESQSEDVKKIFSWAQKIIEQRAAGDERAK